MYGPDGSFCQFKGCKGEAWMYGPDGSFCQFKGCQGVGLRPETIVIIDGSGSGAAFRSAGAIDLARRARAEASAKARIHCNYRSIWLGSSFSLGKGDRSASEACLKPL